MNDEVAPFAGAWIEISLISKFKKRSKSLPSRGRGLKFGIVALDLPYIDVAPFAGAWIEICPLEHLCYGGGVAPFAGAWIEILTGLSSVEKCSVAPFAGAWIEIPITQRPYIPRSGRSLRGGVD